MSLFNSIISLITSRIGHDVGTLAEILSVTLMIMIMSLYEFVVYR